MQHKMDTYTKKDKKIQKEHLLYALLSVTKQSMDPIDFHNIFPILFGYPFFKISSVFSRREKLTQVL